MNCEPSARNVDGLTLRVNLTRTVVASIATADCTCGAGQVMSVMSPSTHALGCAFAPKRHSGTLSSVKVQVLTASMLSCSAVGRRSFIEAPVAGRS